MALKCQFIYNGKRIIFSSLLLSIIFKKRFLIGYLLRHVKMVVGLNNIVFESAKSRALHAIVPTCPRALRALVPMWASDRCYYLLSACCYFSC